MPAEGPASFFHHRFEPYRLKVAAPAHLPDAQNKAFGRDVCAVAGDDHRPANVVGRAARIVGILVGEAPVGDPRGVAEIDDRLIAESRERTALDLIRRSRVSEITGITGRTVNTRGIGETGRD